MYLFLQITLIIMKIKVSLLYSIKYIFVFQFITLLKKNQPKNPKITWDVYITYTDKSNSKGSYAFKKKNQFPEALHSKDQWINFPRTLQRDQHSDFFLRKSEINDFVLWVCLGWRAAYGNILLFIIISKLFLPQKWTIIVS